MKRPSPVNRALVLLALLALWTGMSSGATRAGGWGGDSERYCMRPASHAEFSTSWYEWSKGEGFCPVYTCDRAPVLPAKRPDLCRLAADPRHSQGMELIERINAENDGLSAPVRQLASARPAVVPVIQPRRAKAAFESREAFEYAFPMSRCDEYWGRPWCACPLYVDPVSGDHPAETFADVPTPPASIDASAYRATLRPAASLAANLLGQIGQQMLAMSAALDQLAGDHSAPELHDAADSEAFREPIWRAAWPELHLGL